MTDPETDVYIVRDGGEWVVERFVKPTTRVREVWGARYPQGDPTVPDSGTPYTLGHDEAGCRDFLARHPHPEAYLEVIRTVSHDTVTIFRITPTTPGTEHDGGGDDDAPGGLDDISSPTTATTSSGCCGACMGKGWDVGGPCSDCYGTGHTHLDTEDCR